jgi:hypothetical protein
VVESECEFESSVVSARAGAALPLPLSFVCSSEFHPRNFLRQMLLPCSRYSARVTETSSNIGLRAKARADLYTSLTGLEQYQ